MRYPPAIIHVVYLCSNLAAGHRIYMEYNARGHWAMHFGVIIIFTRAPMSQCFLMSMLTVMLHSLLYGNNSTLSTMDDRQRLRCQICVRLWTVKWGYNG